MKSGYKDLIVWQKAIKLVVMIYDLTKTFPPTEIYGLTSQMRRSSVSIPSNIAEGSKRSTQKDFQHFLSISLGSAAELETQLIILENLDLGDKGKINKSKILLDEVLRMLYSLLKS